jgi:hypothetical protein
MFIKFSDGPSPWLQQPATDRCLEPDEFSPHIHTLFLEDHL